MTIFKTVENSKGTDVTFWWENSERKNKSGRWHGGYISKEHAVKAMEKHYAKTKLMKEANKWRNSQLKRNKMVKRKKE